MKRDTQGMVFGLLLAAVFTVSASAETHYVWTNSPSPTPPYTNWETAAHVIQDAIDLADVGDAVWVTDGVYNAITVDRAIAVRSVNGPKVTSIPGLTTNGVNDRCAFLADGSLLDGFTLRDGRSGGGDGGGVFCANTNVIVTNCVIVGNIGYVGGGVFGGSLYDCTISGNTVTYYVGGGGACGAVLYHCLLISNTACYNGGGALDSELHFCEIRDNSVCYDGGGTFHCTAYDCVYRGNSAGQCGGAAAYGTLYNCLLSGNLSSSSGGGSYCSDLRNCTVIGNSNRGMAWGVAYNSIIYYNQPEGGDAISDDLHNCCTPNSGYVQGEYFTDAPGIVSLESPRLLASSPCINAGTNEDWMGDALDLDGMPRTNGIVDIGAHEYWPQTRTGDISVIVSAPMRLAVPGAALGFSAAMEGQVDDCSWAFGDGATATGLINAVHSFAQTGRYAVCVTAWNLDGGVTSSVSVHICGPDVFVAQNGDDEDEGSDWASAKATIQRAVDDAWPGATRVLVTNGVYDTGGRAATETLTNRVLLDKSLTLQSVNGPEVTFIVGQSADGGSNGEGAVRCVYMSTGTYLAGFALVNGHTRRTYTEHCEGWPKYWHCWITDDSQARGGGVWCETMDNIVSNCIFLNNSAYLSGGGVVRGTLLNCSFVSNRCEASGGGASGSLVIDSTFEADFAGSIDDCAASNCVLTGNPAAGGGGASDSSLVHCRLIGVGTYCCSLDRCVVSGSIGYAIFAGSAVNTLFYENPGGAGEYVSLSHCTVVKSGSGLGISDVTNCIIEDGMTSDPGFVDYDGNDFHLTSTSPCIDAATGNSPPVDLDDIRRPLDGNADAVCAGDLGAYEFVHPTADSDADGLSDTNELFVWHTQPLVPDTDGDRMNDGDEVSAGTGPLNGGSFLGLDQPTVVGLGHLLTWSTVFGKGYWIQRSTDLRSGIWSNLWASPIYELDEYPEGTESFFDLACPSNAPAAYRIELDQ